MKRERSCKRFGQDFSLPKDKQIVKQEFKDDSDINRIISRFMKSGVLPSVDPSRRPQYINIPVSRSGGFDFKQVQDYLARLRSLPLEERKKLLNGFLNPPSAPSPTPLTTQPLSSPPGGGEGGNTSGEGGAKPSPAP